MTTTNTSNDGNRDIVSGTLRPAVAEKRGAPVAQRPGSAVFGRMPKPMPEPVAKTAPPHVPSPLPQVRRRRRVAGMVTPVVIAATGFGSAWVLFETTHSMPIGLVCAGVGLVGAVFCYFLLRERVEIA